MKRVSPPSAHDVARVAGVSQAAVSRAFTPGASIARDTQDKVFRAAKSLGYRPNLIARSLIKGTSGIVGVVIGSPLHNSVFMSALDALSMRLSRAGKHMLIFTADGSTCIDVHVEDLLNYRVDALLLVGAGLSSQLAQQCCDERIPVISLGRRPPGTQQVASVTGNSREGASQMAEHLVQQGYRRIALMAGSAESPTNRERELGFTAYLTSHGFPAPERAVGHCQREGALLAARSLLSLKSRPDAIFCTNDDMALATIEISRQEFGLEVGREIGIAGFDDNEEAAWPMFDLTTYALPMQTMIEQAVTILTSASQANEPVHVTVDGVLKPRRSTQRNSK